MWREVDWLEQVRAYLTEAHHPLPEAEALGVDGLAMVGPALAEVCKPAIQLSQGQPQLHKQVPRISLRHACVKVSAIPREAPDLATKLDSA